MEMSLGFKIFFSQGLYCSWEPTLVTAHPFLLLGHLHLGKIWLLHQAQIILMILVVCSAPLVQNAINCI